MGYYLTVCRDACRGYATVTYAIVSYGEPRANVGKVTLPPGSGGDSVSCITVTPSAKAAPYPPGGLCGAAPPPPDLGNQPETVSDPN
ncbi:hypothetical protein Mth01_40970 [Sphaerimonospora thailandensis]|uniref:Uncharacterized protein n=1 Tax=Sphaerimonospora thailandensis TaxID=795644 RepID=A0A8J3RDL5_9ACTN|nr:hypothetical protein Mth01_40970 [Sphaerimonospora thailandensis]